MDCLNRRAEENPCSVGYDDSGRSKKPCHCKCRKSVDVKQKHSRSSKVDHGVEKKAKCCCKHHRSKHGESCKKSHDPLRQKLLEQFAKRMAPDEQTASQLSSVNMTSLDSKRIPSEDFKKCRRPGQKKSDTATAKTPSNKDRKSPEPCSRSSTPPGKPPEKPQPDDPKQRQIYSEKRDVEVTCSISKDPKAKNEAGAKQREDKSEVRPPKCPAAAESRKSPPADAEPTRRMNDISCLVRKDDFEEGDVLSCSPRPLKKSYEGEAFEGAESKPGGPNQPPKSPADEMHEIQGGPTKGETRGRSSLPFRNEDVPVVKQTTARSQEQQMASPRKQSPVRNTAQRTTANTNVQRENDVQEKNPQRNLSNCNTLQFTSMSCTDEQGIARNKSSDGSDTVYVPKPEPKKKGLFQPGKPCPYFNKSYDNEKSLCKSPTPPELAEPSNENCRSPSPLRASLKGTSYCSLCYPSDSEDEGEPEFRDALLCADDDAIFMSSLMKEIQRGDPDQLKKFVAMSVKTDHQKKLAESMAAFMDSLGGTLEHWNDFSDNFRKELEGLDKQGNKCKLRVLWANNRGVFLRALEMAMTDRMNEEACKHT